MQHLELGEAPSGSRAVAIDFLARSSGGGPVSSDRCQAPATGHNRAGNPGTGDDRDQTGHNSGQNRCTCPSGKPARCMKRETRSTADAPEAEDVVGQLERILASGDFDASPRSRAFVRFIVEETLAGRQEGLTQAAIATRVFERREDFDPTVDPIVRIQAGRLRRSLERYYLLSGAADPVRIELPRGSYVPVGALGRRERRSVPRERAPGTGLADRDGWPSVVVRRIRGRRRRRGARGGGGAAQGAALPRDGPLRRRARGAAARARPARPRPLRARRLRPLGTSLPRRSDHAHHRAPAGLPVTRARSGRRSTEAPGDSSSAFYEETARMIAARVASEQGVVAKQLWAAQRQRRDRSAPALRRDPALVPVLLQPRAFGLRSRSGGAAAGGPRAAGVRARLGAARPAVHRELRVRDRAGRDPDRRGHRPCCRTQFTSTRPASAPGPRSPQRSCSRASSAPGASRRRGPTSSAPTRSCTWSGSAGCWPWWATGSGARPSSAARSSAIPATSRWRCTPSGRITCGAGSSRRRTRWPCASGTPPSSGGR